MTLDEAIKHCYEKGNKCCECGKEHLQLAEWLQELKKLRKDNIELKDEVRLWKSNCNVY